VFDAVEIFEKGALQQVESVWIQAGASSTWLGVGQTTNWEPSL
jgi:hypothetical protein